MKKLINDPKAVVDESVEGFGLAHADLVTVHPDPKFIVRKDAPVAGKVGLVDDLGRTLAFRTEETLVENGPEDVCARMGRWVLEAAGAAGATAGDIRGVGLGTPGPQDLKAGFIIKAGNLPGFDRFNVRDFGELAGALGC